MSAAPGTVGAWADRAARLAAIALGFSIPVSTALDEFLSAVLTLGIVAGGQYRTKRERIGANTFGLAVIAFFLLHVIGATYSMGEAADVLDALSKVSIILLVPLLIALSPERKLRDHALSAFMAASLLTLALSYLLWFGVLPEGGWAKGIRVDPVIFKKHITHSVLMAFAAYLFVLKARDASRSVSRAGFALAGALAAFNVLYMANGRTGQLILLALVVYGLWRQLRWTGAAIAVAVCVGVAATAYFATSNPLHHRAKATLEELENWRAGRPSVNSDNMRPKVWGNSMEIARRHPLVGVGTGGFAAAYLRQAGEAGPAQVTHAENQYLSTAVELGVVGLAALVMLLTLQWRFAGNLAPRSDTELARGLIIAMLIGCVFNSFLRDHTEALFFAWLSGLLFAGWRPSSAGG